MLLLSIDVCGDKIYVAEGSATSGNVDIRKCCETKMPPGTVEDGDIKNHAAFVAALIKMLSSHSFKATSAVLTFTSNAVLSRRLELPPAKPKEITAMVRSQMVQSVSDPTEYAFEYSCHSNSSNSKNTVVWAYALEKSFIDKYYIAFKSLKVRPSALDIHSNCVEKLLLNVDINGANLRDKAILLVGIERNFIEIHLFGGGERAFSRISPVKASEFLMIIKNLGYGSASNSFEMPFEPSGSQKSEADICSSIDISPEKLESDSILAEAAHQYTGKIADELLKMIQFQLRRDSSKPISHVYTYGGFSGIKGLCENLSHSLSCPVETIKSISHVKISDEIPLTKYINAIGALIRI